MIRSTLAILIAALAVPAPAMAAPNVFWTFGFYFPDQLNHRAGGFAGLGSGIVASSASQDPLAGAELEGKALRGSRVALAEARPIYAGLTGMAGVRAIALDGE